MWENDRQKIPHKRREQLEEVTGIPAWIFAMNNIEDADKQTIDSYAKAKGYQIREHYYKGEEKMVNGNILVSAIRHAIDSQMCVTEQNDIVYAALKRARIFIDNVDFFGVDVVGRTLGEFEESCKEKRNVLFLTDEELLEYEKTKRIIEYIKGEAR